LTFCLAFSFAYISYYVDQSVRLVCSSNAHNAPQSLHAYFRFNSRSCFAFLIHPVEYWCAVVVFDLLTVTKSPFYVVLVSNIEVQNVAFNSF